MRLDSSRADAVPVSPATWGAIGALVLLLGALSLLLLGCDRVFGLHLKTPCPDGTLLTANGICSDRVPNYHACACECTKGLSVGARIRTVAAIAVRPNPGAGSATVVAIGAEGNIIEDRDVVIGGVTGKWWRIRFDSSVVGWTNATSPALTVLSSGPLVTRDLEVCLPPEYNANLGVPPFEVTPDSSDIIADCTDRVLPAFVRGAGPLPPGSTCACAPTLPTPANIYWVSECDAGCNDFNGLCLVAETTDVAAATLSTALS